MFMDTCCFSVINFIVKFECIHLKVPDFKAGSSGTRSFMREL